MGSRSSILILLLAASPLRAQDRSPRLDLQMPAAIVAKVDAPTVALQHVLAEGHRRELLSAGFPAVLHCRVELWRKGRLFFFYDREAVVEWDLVVEYAPATTRYQVRRQQDGKFTELGEVATLDEAEQIVDRAYRVPVSPKARGASYFYLYTVDLSTLSLNDLDAWQRWVRGDAGPAVRGEGNILTALKHGAGSLFSRVLGGETQHYEVRAAFKAG